MAETGESPRQRTTGDASRSDSWVGGGGGQSKQS